MSREGLTREPRLKNRSMQPLGHTYPCSPPPNDRRTSSSAPATRPSVPQLDNARLVSAARGDKPTASSEALRRSPPPRLRGNGVQVVETLPCLGCPIRVRGQRRFGHSHCSGASVIHRANSSLILLVARCAASASGRLKSSISGR
jgi:hypothetical protein